VHDLREIGYGRGEKGRWGHCPWRFLAWPPRRDPPCAGRERESQSPEKRKNHQKNIAPIMEVDRFSTFMDTLITGPVIEEFHRRRTTISRSVLTLCREKN